jgi:hypothetical protein
MRIHSNPIARTGGKAAFAFCCLLLSAAAPEDPVAALVDTFLRDMKEHRVAQAASLMSPNPRLIDTTTGERGSFEEVAAYFQSCRAGTPNSARWQAGHGRQYVSIAMDCVAGRRDQATLYILGDRVDEIWFGEIPFVVAVPPHH